MALVRTGDHICCLFNTEEEHLSIATRYIAEGLRQREHCLYAGRSPAVLARFEARLADEGIDVQRMVENGALTLATTADTHLAHGRFDSEWMLRMMNDKLEAVMNAGFTGLRTCGDMSWLLDDAPGAGDVVVYEALCTEFFKNTRAVGMCMYDRARLPAGLLDSALSTHPTTFVNGGCQRNHLDRSRQIIDAHRMTNQGTGNCEADSPS